jgi:metal-responsive CopG/Arc/MetJ family transcriptional regulator
MSNPITDPPLSVLVPLPSDLARTIDTLAERRGQDRAQFIVSFLREGLDRSATSLEEIVSPIAEEFRRSGMTEEELDDLVEQERQAVWSEKHS